MLTADSLVRAVPAVGVSVADPGQGEAPPRPLSAAPLLGTTGPAGGKKLGEFFRKIWKLVWGNFQKRLGGKSWGNFSDKSGN